MTATPKTVCEAILDFYGADHPKRMTLPQMVHAVRTSLYDHGTKVLLLDDISRLRMHREADQDALDLLRSLMSMHLTLVLIGVGIPDLGLLTEGRRLGGDVIPSSKTGRRCNPHAATQTARRFDLIDLDPFRYDTPADIYAWVTHLAGIEDQLRLFRAEPGMLTSGTMPEYLFRRTNGIVGLLERLIEDGCAYATDTGTERLTVDLLDTVDINLGTIDGRDATAGEIPAIPPRASASRGQRHKPRNTVFDDEATTRSATRRTRA